MACSFVCQLIPVFITSHAVVVRYVVQRSAYVHYVRYSWITYLANVERMIVSIPLNGANSFDSGRFVEAIRYIDCRSIEGVGVELCDKLSAGSWCT